MRASRCFVWGALSAGMALACSSGGGNAPQPVSLIGVVRDYFVGTALNLVTLTVDGRPTLNATSSVGGAYEFSDVPTNTTLQVVGALANYRATRNEPITIAASSVITDLRMVSTSDVLLQYAAVGRTQNVGTAVVFADLVDAGGQPRDAIPAADISLVDGTQTPVGLGPYIFGASGALDGTLTATTVFNGRSRVGFLDVPPGTLTLRVTVTTPAPATLTTTAVTTAGGATLLTR